MSNLKLNKYLFLYFIVIVSCIGNYTKSVKKKNKTLKKIISTSLLTYIASSKQFPIIKCHSNNCISDSSINLETESNFLETTFKWNTYNLNSNCNPKDLYINEKPTDVESINNHFKSKIKYFKINNLETEKEKSKFVYSINNTENKSIKNHNFIFCNKGNCCKGKVRTKHYKQNRIIKSSIKYKNTIYSDKELLKAPYNKRHLMNNGSDSDSSSSSSSEEIQELIKMSVISLTTIASIILIGLISLIVCCYLKKRTKDDNYNKLPDGEEQGISSAIISKNKSMSINSTKLNDCIDITHTTIENMKEKN